MKKLILLLFIGTLFVVSPTRVSAEVRISVNIDAMPQWGPVGFDRAEYYYLPEAGIYYYVPRAQFVYQQGGRWRFSNRLPYQYRNLNLFSTYKVVINRPRPYMQHSYYVSHYRGYRNYHSRQGTIRDNRGRRNDRGNRMGNDRGNRMGNDHGNRMGNDHGNRMGNDHGNRMGNDRGNRMGNDHGNRMGNDHGNRMGNDRGNRMGNDHGNRMGNMQHGGNMQSAPGGKGNKGGQMGKGNNGQGNRGNRGNGNNDHR